MKFCADLHIHSKYSRATSKTLDLEHLDLWARRKGIHVVGTGDFTHPGWLAELEEKLEETEEGLYRLRAEHQKTLCHEFLPAMAAEVRFILTVEISSIYKKHDRVRKVHNVLFAPDLAAAARISKRLGDLGNVKSDGRPILGLDSRDLLEITLDCSEDAYLVPAHIWTPHFSMLGSRSGFDSMEECFGDLTDRIFAVETGLSSDPPMNWRLKALDGVKLISNSDAHSPAKLGREANLFDTALSFPGIRKALEDRGGKGFLGTIEFFPEEGKYHYDGHRKCFQRMDPVQTRAADGLCPACGKKVTLGVMHRVEVLADREEGVRPPGRADYHSLIPLQEILGEILSVGPNSKKVMGQYQGLLEKLGPELYILKDAPLERLDRGGLPLLREAVEKMRRGDVQILAGYDGAFGTVSIFRDDEREVLEARYQGRLFA